VRALAVAAVAVALLGGGCRRPRGGDEPGAAPPPAAPPTLAQGSGDAPADHLAPGELVEGSGQVFGITLPRVLVVKARFVDVAYADAAASVHSLAQYFRARVTDGTMREGPVAATFEHVHARGQASGGADLLVRIAATANGATVEIRDTTPPPAAVLPDEPSRWRNVGLTPEGRLADPAHLD